MVRIHPPQSPESPISINNDKRAACYPVARLSLAVREEVTSPV